MYSAPYHQILDNLYLGNFTSIQSRKFNMIVNCTKEYEISFPKDYIKDDPLDSSALLSFLQNTNILEQIDNTLKNNQSVLVHCSKGQQRSCAVVACYLIRFFQMKIDKAIEYIKSKRPIAFFGNVNLIEAITDFYQTYKS
jgi:protein-tyrosine phosphatase